MDLQETDGWARLVTFLDQCKLYFASIDIAWVPGEEPDTGSKAAFACDNQRGLSEYVHHLSLRIEGLLVSLDLQVQEVHILSSELAGKSSAQYPIDFYIQLRVLLLTIRIVRPSVQLSPLVPHLDLSFLLAHSVPSTVAETPLCSANWLAKLQCRSRRRARCRS